MSLQQRSRSRKTTSSSLNVLTPTKADSAHVSSAWQASEQPRSAYSRRERRDDRQDPQQHVHHVVGTTVFARQRERNKVALDREHLDVKNTPNLISSPVQCSPLDEKMSIQLLRGKRQTRVNLTIHFSKPKSVKPRRATWPRTSRPDSRCVRLAHGDNSSWQIHLRAKTLRLAQ